MITYECDRCNDTLRVVGQELGLPYMWKYFAYMLLCSRCCDRALSAMRDGGFWPEPVESATGAA